MKMGRSKKGLGLGPKFAEAKLYCDIDFKLEEAITVSIDTLTDVPDPTGPITHHEFTGIPG